MFTIYIEYLKKLASNSTSTNSCYQAFTFKIHNYFSTFNCFISNNSPLLAPDGDDAGREGVDEAGQVVEVVAVHRLVVS